MRERTLSLSRVLRPELNATPVCVAAIPCSYAAIAEDKLIKASATDRSSAATIILTWPSSGNNELVYVFCKRASCAPYSFRLLRNYR